MSVVINDGRLLKLVEVAHAPWGSFADTPLRPVLIVHGCVRSAVLVRPRVELPILWRTDERCVFELPVLQSWELVHAEAFICVEFQGMGEEAETLSIPIPPIARNSLDVLERVKCESEAEKDDARLATQVLADHRDTVGELLFPSAVECVKPARVSGLVPVSWTALHSALDLIARTDEGRLRLIVQIADECADVLRSICASPRQLLRRERRMTDLGRVEQLDEACIRWFVKQPGRTVLEKAGSRQQILAVRREHSFDTLENRVVRDFLERSRRACDRYVAEHLAKRLGPRVTGVLRFRRLIDSWLADSPIGSIPRPVGVLHANYVLQFDSRYGRVWPWYERLRREQQDEAEVWRWQHRAWAEHVLVTLDSAMSLSKPLRQRYVGRCYLRSGPRVGSYLADESVADVWSGSSNDSDRLVTSVLPPRYGSEPISNLACVDLAPDSIVYTTDRMGLLASGRKVAVWAALRPLQRQSVDALDSSLQALDAAIRRQADNDICGILVVPLLPGAAPLVEPILRLEGGRRDARTALLAIPTPVGKHVDWLSKNLGAWELLWR